jgi:hypothetical protein
MRQRRLGASRRHGFEQIPERGAPAPEARADRGAEGAQGSKRTVTHSRMVPL